MHCTDGWSFFLSLLETMLEQILKIWELILVSWTVYPESGDPRLDSWISLEEQRTFKQVAISVLTNQWNTSLSLTELEFRFFFKASLLVQGVLSNTIVHAVVLCKKKSSNTLLLLRISFSHLLKGLKYAGVFFFLRCATEHFLKLHSIKMDRLWTYGWQGMQVPKVFAIFL